MNKDLSTELSKNVIRERVAAFVKRWEGVTSEQGERQTFWNEFHAIFGVDRLQVAIFEELAERASTGGHGWIDLLFPKQMAVEHKTTGKNLDEAMDQLIDYLPSLHKSELPWLLVVCDFATFQWKNLSTGDSGTFPLTELGSNVHLFWWMAGHGTPHESFEDEEEANLVATGLLADLHDSLKESGYDEHALREWMTRILFCLFADDTEVWDRAAFHAWVTRSTRVDGSDLGSHLAHLFQVLNTPPASRPKNLDEDLAAFTYINGDLFSNTLPIASCDETTRNALLEACGFDWSVLSPVIFGSLFQNVTAPADRRQLGAHYTSEENILRTISPLFLDGLWAELEAATSKPKLQSFHDKIASMKFLDPACGCGNFLVLAYRELRRLETETLRRLAAKNKKQSKGQRATSLDLLCKVTVDQFYGIEIDEWPARIARTAMYLIDHIANREVSAEFGEHYIRFPIPAAPHIVNENALRSDWESVLPAEQADFVFGNPPFLGFRLRSEEQQADLLSVMPKGTPKRIDYVLGWYAKAMPYVKAGPAVAAFVSTNSITQGEQAPVLAALLDRWGCDVTFAHRTFEWTNEARGRAHVHVVIVGFADSDTHSATQRPLYIYENVNEPGEMVKVRAINQFLAPAPMVDVPKRRQPLIDNVPTLDIGSKPNDGGFLIVEPDEYDTVAADPTAATYLRRLMGSKEFLHDLPRWCLWLADAPPGTLKSSTLLRDRVAGVRSHRLASTNAATQRTADTPTLFWNNKQPTASYLAVPEVSSERRAVVPMGYLDPSVVATNKLYTIADAPLWLFGILQSSMFASWARAVGGRMKSDISLSPGVVYNTFPFVIPKASSRKTIEQSATAILDARTNYPEATLAELYDPLSTPPDLLTAHRNLDRAVDALYGRHKHKGDATRLPVLFREHTAITGGDLSLFDDPPIV